MTKAEIVNRINQRTGIEKVAVSVAVESQMERRKSYQNNGSNQIIINIIPNNETYNSFCFMLNHFFLFDCLFPLFHRSGKKLFMVFWNLAWLVLVPQCCYEPI